LLFFKYAEIATTLGGGCRQFLMNPNTGEIQGGVFPTHKGNTMKIDANSALKQFRNEICPNTPINSPEIFHKLLREIEKLRHV